MITLAQLIAIMKYEIKMQWRRRALLVIFAGFLVISLLATAGMKDTPAAIIPTDADPAAVVELPAHMQREGAATITLGEMRFAGATYATTYAAFISMLLAMLAPPVLLAEAIPIDRQIGVKAILNSLPLSRMLYLLGKLLGVWAGLLLVLGAGIVIEGLLAWFIIGPYDILSYAFICLVVVVPPVLAASGIGVLLAATQPNRRRAAVLGLLLTPLWGGFYFITLMNALDVIAWINPLYAFFTPTETLTASSVTQSTLGVLGVMGLGVLLAGAVAWVYARKEQLS